MPDNFDLYRAALESPPENAFAVTPDDGADLPTFTRCINVAGTGTVRVTTVHGDTVTLFVAAGITFPIRARRIHATGTDASNIVAMY